MSTPADTPTAPATTGARAADGGRTAADGGRTAADGPPRPAPYLWPLTAVDGLGSVALGLVLLVAPGWLATGLGLATDRPLQVVGLLFVLNGIANGRAVSRRSWGSLATCVVIDLVFAGMVLGLVLADPWSSQAWARWAMAGLALVSFDVGGLKLWALRRISP